MTDLLTLATRIEAADGPDREIDREIALAVGWTFRVDQHDDDMREDVWTDPAGREHAWNPFFMHSIDAAMSLVPDGCWIEGSLVPFAGTQSVVEIHSPTAVDRIGVAWAATPALALAAAAIRARAS